jgi:hypothetical protein
LLVVSFTGANTNLGGVITEPIKPGAPGVVRGPEGSWLRLDSKLALIVLTLRWALCHTFEFNAFFIN